MLGFLVFTACFCQTPKGIVFDRRLPECNIQFQMMLFESLSHSDFSNGITCVALQLVAVSVEPRPSVQGNFLNETRFCDPYKTTLRNKTAKRHYNAS